MNKIPKKELFLVLCGNFLVLCGNFLVLCGNFFGFFKRFFRLQSAKTQSVNQKFIINSNGRISLNFENEQVIEEIKEHINTLVSKT